jgi:hypothetical protein
MTLVGQMALPLSTSTWPLLVKAEPLTMSTASRTPEEALATVMTPIMPTVSTRAWPSESLLGRQPAGALTPRPGRTSHPQRRFWRDAPCAGPAAAAARRSARSWCAAAPRVLRGQSDSRGGLSQASLAGR